MKIKALVVWDPWAWLTRLLLKIFETRGWETSYRGPLLICAAKRPVDREYLMNVNRVLRDHDHEGISIDDLRPGHAVALVDLTAVIRCKWTRGGSLKSPEITSFLERRFGDFSPGRYAWKLENVRAIEPFPVKGRQGLFEVEVPEDLAACL